MNRFGDVSLVIVGAGQRGSQYAELVVREGATIVAIADPSSERRERLADVVGVSHDRCFDDWSDLAARGRLSMAAIVATPDRLHRDPAVALLDLGYDVLLEKPMAPNEPDAEMIVAAAERRGAHLAVAHVMRYQPLTRAIEAQLGAGGIGEIVSIQHLEPIGDWHFTHSFVRGNWRNEEQSASVLLAKSCHDIDWLSHLVRSRPVRVSSFGGLYEFRPERAPDGAGERCLDCTIEPDCPFSAKRAYLPYLDLPNRESAGQRGDRCAHRGRAGCCPETGPYGRCVYHSDNDVLDHQAVNIEYESGVVASFLMSAFTPMGGRETRIGGTKGHLEVAGDELKVYRFLDRSVTMVPILEDEISQQDAAAGHSGGDIGLIRAFVGAVRSGESLRVPTDGAKACAPIASSGPLRRPAGKRRWSPSKSREC